MHCAHKTANEIRPIRTQYAQHHLSNIKSEKESDARPIARPAPQSEKNKRHIRFFDSTNNNDNNGGKTTRKVDRTREPNNFEMCLQT